MSGRKITYLRRHDPVFSVETATPLLKPHKTRAPREPRSTTPKVAGFESDWAFSGWR